MCVRKLGGTVFSYLQKAIIIIIIKTLLKAMSSQQKHCESSPCSSDNVEQCQTAADPWTKRTDLGHKSAMLVPASIIVTLLVLRPTAETHFNLPRSVEGYVDLGSVSVPLWSAQLTCGSHGTSVRMPVSLRQNSARPVVASSTIDATKQKKTITCSMSGTIGHTNVNIMLLIALRRSSSKKQDI